MCKCAMRMHEYESNDNSKSTSVSTRQIICMHKEKLRGTGPKGKRKKEELEKEIVRTNRQQAALMPNTVRG